MSSSFGGCSADLQVTQMDTLAPEETCADSLPAQWALGWKLGTISRGASLHLQSPLSHDNSKDWCSNPLKGVECQSAKTKYKEMALTKYGHVQATSACSFRSWLLQAALQ